MTRRYVILYFLEDGMNVLLNFSFQFLLSACGIASALAVEWLYHTE